MPRKVKRGTRCSSAPRKSKSCYKRKSLLVASKKKKIFNCGCRKRRQSRRRMRGSGYRGTGSGSGLGGSPILPNKV